MASDMLTAQHNCKGLLKFILPDNMVTVDLEGIILTGIHTYRKDRNCSEKSLIPPTFFTKRLNRPQGERSKEFLESILDQDLEPNFRPNPSVNVQN